LLGGFHAWTAAGGETEPITAAAGPMPQQQNTNAQPTQTHVVASPNPTIDDSKTKAGDAPKTVEGTPVQPDATTTGAPMKTTKGKKSKHRRTKPASD
jgi:hypothetical protein